MTDVVEIDAITAKSWRDAGEAVLLDVRESPELAAARIADAVHNPMSAFDFDAVPNEPGKKLVVFCAHGMRSFQVADYLLRQGKVDAVYSMDGGIVAWADAGLPIEQG